MKGKTRTRKPLDLTTKVQIHVPGDYPWKVLGKLAEDLGQFLSDDERWLITYIVRNRDFASYLSLGEAWGLQSISPQDTNLENVKAKYQLTALLKKFQFPGDRNARIQKAVEKFQAAEDNCRAFNHGGWKALVFGLEEWEVEAITYAKSFLRRLLGDRLPGSKVMTLWSRHGPGSNLDTCQGQNSLYHKYENWPYSCTIDAFRYARFLIQSDERWFGALIESYRDRVGIPMHYPLDMNAFWASVIKIVDGNRIDFVPKSSETERTIAIEPSLNLMLQLGVDGVIRKRLKRYGVDLDCQEKNQEMARLGSLGKGFVTLDLAAASDSISVRLVEELVPWEWTRYLMDLRSPCGTMGSNRDARIFRYAKISSMGNGYTFALESAIFTAIIRGVLIATKGRCRNGDYAVFGDDLIVPEDCSSRVVSLLARCGFSVNSEKSFFNGPIRESCGADWFSGTPIRPVFLSEMPSSLLDLWTDRNRLARILKLRWNLEESKITTLLDRWVPEKFLSWVGPLSDEDFGSYMHCSFSLKPYKYCMYEYNRLVIQPVGLRGNRLHMRKLMASLRPGLDEPRPSWSRQPIGGSRFTVTRRQAWKVGYTVSRTSIWCDEYTEVTPRKMWSSGDLQVPLDCTIPA